MTVRSISRTALEISLTLVRLPLDAVIGRLPGNGTGAQPAARLALDRADATLRAVAGTMLGDPVLREHAQTRRAALKERERAHALRGEAQEKTQEADARLQERQDQVARQRAQAELRAKSRRDAADRQRRAKTRRAGELERTRLAASDNATGRADEAVNQRAPRATLETLDAKSDALRRKEAALAASDEANRLREAAGRAKTARRAK